MIETKPVQPEPVVVPPAPPVPKTVKVELVWPAERGAKSDCRGGTKVVWSGKGDVQDYPAELWHKLEPHPDVWRLVDPAQAQVAAEATLLNTESPERRVERLNLAREAERQAAAQRDEDARIEAERVAALQAKERGAETNTDVVHAGLPEAAPAQQPQAQQSQAMTLDADQLAQMSDADVHAEAVKRGYPLHPRLNAVNLRARFLEAQARSEGARA